MRTARSRTSPVHLVASLGALLALAACSHQGTKGFQPGAASGGDVTPPTVSSTTPAAGLRNVPVNTSLNVTFSEDMAPSTITPATFTVAGLTPVTVTYDVVSRIATYTPTTNLANSTTFTATINTGAQDLAGNGLASSFIWSFTTAAAPDTTRPTVLSPLPANAATGFPTNGRPSITFSEAMLPTSISSTSFTLQQGATNVTGTVTYADAARIATFAPAATLTAGVVYTGTITTAVEDLAGNNLASSFVWTFTTAAAPDTTAPTVDTVSPLIGSTAALNTMVNASFSEAIDPATITTATFRLTGPGTTPVPGTLAYIDVQGNRSNATFDPTGDLPANTTITGTITTGVRDLAGNALASDFVWTFRSGAAPDTTAPTVTATIPTASAINVAVNSDVAAAFSESMDPSTINQTTFTVSSGTAITGQVTYVEAGRVATFDPTNDLAAGTTYTAVITVGAEDLAGNPAQQSFTWTFTTGAAPDLTPPTVTAVNPIDGATNVFINKKVNATFSEDMDAASISTLTFRLAAGPTPVSGTVQFDALQRIATFAPTVNLAANTTYTATITTGTADLAGNTLTSDMVWSFTTGIGAAQEPINLRSAGLFAVLAGAAVSNVSGPTVVNGDLGVSPLEAVNGFPPGVVNGTIHTPSRDSVAGLGNVAGIAQGDLTTAYNDAQGRTLGPILVAGNIGGQTLPPGLYKCSGDLEISSGDLTLDAQGDPSAVFIFQIATRLDTTPGRKVFLIGGAKAANVFWAVGTSSTLDTTTEFKGTIMADQAITLNTGVRLEGRVLARIAAISVADTVITIPAP